MRQLLQSLKNGVTEILEVPCPRCGPGKLLIEARRSLISAGTERMLVDFGRANPIEKALQQPEKVKMVLEKVATDGVMATASAVRSKLDQPIPLGYSSVGRVLEVGAGVEGFQVGDLVVSNGSHAEIVAVPRNLCARVPEGVSEDAAAFVVVGSIGLQGVRLAAPTLGERFVVIGLGLIGLLTAQLLRAHGCEVMGVDLDPARAELARKLGVEVVAVPSQGDDVLAVADGFSEGRGVDGVLITAATKSALPVQQAARMSRKRGRIVLVGVAGLQLDRSEFYEKELSFQVSCSYGPGRYDDTYEAGGQDYPFGFVRWTEQRNFEAILQVIRSGQLQIEPLITHRFAFEQAGEAYDLLSGGEPSLGILLEYPESEEAVQRKRRPRIEYDEGVEANQRRGKAGGKLPVIGVLGAGNYATAQLLPRLSSLPVRLRSIASSGGVSGTYAARKFGFEVSTTDTDSLFTDEAIDTVIILTRHDSHARYVCRALEMGKNVFVEKPLVLTREELEQVREAYARAREDHPGIQVMVGFNRRFAPLVEKGKELLRAVPGPKSVLVTVNAGAIPGNHWVHSKEVGGGRILGEGCHFVDLIRYLVGASPVRVVASRIGEGPGVEVRDDKVSFTITYEDGSIGTVHYLANGHKAFPKERVEVFAAEKVLQLDNFLRLKGWGFADFKKTSLWSQDKGHSACLEAFVESLRSGDPAPIPFEELVEVTETTLEVAELSEGS